MKKLLFSIATIALFSSLAQAASTDVMTGLRSTCTVAGGEWDAKGMLCFKAKKDEAGTPCDSSGKGVVMFASNNAKYCCQAYDVNKKGDQYSVKCNPI
jgi:hypothetical protein